MAYTAIETRRQVDQIRENTTPVNPLGVGDTLDETMQQIVEDGTLIPHGDITAELSLTWRERLTGARTQNVTAVFCLGLMLGAALERDVPKNTEHERAWRNGEFTFPEGDR